MTTAALPESRASFSTDTTATLGAGAGRTRIRSLDIARGAVMALMALDHVRIFFGNFSFEPTDLARTTTALFFTRWLTHFCAPAFIFLAGAGAFLYGTRVGSKRTLSLFLLTRGLWLLAIELTLARLGWTFNLDYAHYLLGGVIWGIGWCMILLAGLVHLPLAAIAIFGVVVICGHNLLDLLSSNTVQTFRAGPWRWLWQVLYFGGPIRLGGGGPLLIVLYSIVPWIGVMAAGYAFGAVLLLPPPRRRRICLWIGCGAIFAFLALRGLNFYGETRPWGGQSSWWFNVLSFINTRKYPASLPFLLMTLGPTIALLPALEHARGRVANVLTVFGRVPFLYYVLHLPLIHGLAALFSLARHGEIVPWLTRNHPVMAPPPPANYGHGLFVIYLVTALTVFLLYWPCRWFAGVKDRRRAAWLSFL